MRLRDATLAKVREGSAKDTMIRILGIYGPSSEELYQAPWQDG